MANRKDLIELNKLLADLEKKYKSLNRNSPFKGKEAKQVAKEYGSIANATKEVETSLKGIRSDILGMNSGLDDMKESFFDIAKELGQMNQPLKNMTKSFNKIKNLADDLSDIQYNIANSSRKEIGSLKAKVNLEFNRLRSQIKFLENKKVLSKKEAELLEFARDQSKALDEQVGHQKQFNAAIEKSLDNQKNISKAMGLTGKLIKGLGGFAEKIGFGDMSEDVSNVTDEMKAHAVTLTDNGEKAATMGDMFKVMGTGLAGLGKSLMKSLSDPLVILGLIVKAVKFIISLYGQMLKKVRDVGQGFGLSGEQAQKMKDEIHAAGDATGDMFYFTEELLAAQLSMNSAVGMNLKFNEKNAKTFQDMTLYAGLSVESATSLFRLSKEMGFGFDGAYDAVSDVTDSLFKQTGYAMKTDDAIAAIVNTSESVKFNIKGGLQGLVKAAHTAKRLGLSMDEIAAASASHLDFESSIGAEMEAEMFLQKDLNLEKLRMAALTGDTATQASEIERLIAQNGPNLRGNMIAQQKFAAALGISQEQLSKSLNTEKMITNAKGDQVKATKQNLKAEKELGQDAVAFDRAMQSAIKQLKAALEPIAKKIGPLILKMVKAIGPIISAVLSFLGTKTGMIMMGMAAGFMAIKGAVGLVSGISQFFSGKLGSNPAMPMYTYNVNESGGGGGGDFMRMAGNMLGRRGTKGGKTFKMLSKVFGGKNSMVGRQLRNLSAMNFKRSSILNQVVKNSSFLSKKIPSMANLNSKVAGGTQAGSDYANLVLKSKNVKTGTNVAGDVLSKSAPLATKTATKMSTKILSKIPLLGALLDVGFSGYFGASDAAMSKDEKKSMGIKEEAGAVELSAMNLFTGSSAKGSILTEMLGGEKGSVGDESLGIGTAAASGALTGAGIGAAIGVWFGGVGAAPGAAIGAGIGAIAGTVAEGLKIFTDPNSSMRQGLVTFADDVTTGIGEAFTSAGDTLSEFGSTAKTAIGDFATSSYDAVSSMATSSAEIATQAYSYAAETANSVASSIESGINSSLSAVSDGANYVGSGISNAAGAVGDFAGDTWDTISSWSPFAEGGMVKGPTKALIGEAGAEAVVPLTEFYAKIDELIAAVNRGGNVYLDGNKVGKTLAMNASEF